MDNKTGEGDKEMTWTSEAEYGTNKEVQLTPWLALASAAIWRISLKFFFAAAIEALTLTVFDSHVTDRRTDGQTD